MTKANDPMMPTIEHGYTSVGTPETTTTPGLTKREYFAAMTMQGLMSAEGFSERLSTEGGENTMLKTMCIASVKAADALITQLNQQP